MRPLFRDRKAAGRALAAQLAPHIDPNDDVVVLGLPRGGVPVAAEVAAALGAPLDVFVVRKLGVPGHEELAMGAIAGDGTVVMNADVVRRLGIDDAAVALVVAREREELERRQRTYHGDRPPIDVEGRTVVLVDDGLATGATMRAAVKAVEQHGPLALIVAVPVASADTTAGFENIVVVETPASFFAVGQAYEDFGQTTDDEVRALLYAVMKITELWRYPVKSMQGERLDAVEIAERGLTGDRAFALIDNETGHVVSAKHPRKWRQLLHCHAALDDGGVATITLPDGATTRSDDPEVNARLSAVFARDVTLASSAPDDRHYEMLYPDIEGVAPQDVIDDNRTADESDGTLTDMGLGLLAPPTSFFDLTVLHFITSATLAAVGQPVRRFRPNVVVDAGGTGYVENEWAGRSVGLGATTVAQVLMPTMRCVMTTLAQPGLDADRGVLKTLAHDNRIDIPGVGTWACAGVYATVVSGGKVAVGDDVQVS